MTAALGKLSPRIDEFHATEIVNPKSKSEWKSVSPEIRLHLLELLIGLLADNAEFVGLCYVSGKDYHRMLAAAAKDPGMTQKTALWKVFFDCLIEVFRKRGEDYAVVVDSPKRLRNVIKIHASRYPEGLYEGVIFADSRDEKGLQLADLAAYMVNRSHHIAQREADGKLLNQFDRLIKAAMTRIRLIHLLEVYAELSSNVPG